MSRSNDARGLDWSGRLALVLVAMTAIGLLAISSSKLVEASVPSDQVTIPVSGTLGGVTTSPTISPQFSSSISDYVIYCGVGVNVITFHLSAATGTIQAGGQSGASITLTVNVGEGQAAVVQNSTAQYWIRCLPHDFPVLQINRPSAPPAGYYLTGNITSSSNSRSGTYAMILDSNGTPVWYQAAPGGAIDVSLLSGNNIAWIPTVGPGIGADPNGAFRLYQLDSQTTSSIRAAPSPPAPTDPHELLELSNGHHMLIATPLKTGVDLSAFPSLAAANNTIADCWLEELDSSGNQVWLWKASDHINVNESTRPILASYNGQTVADLYHCNSIDTQSATGNVLLSVRHTDAVYLINKSTQATIWKMGGNGHRETGAQALTLVGDSEGGFFAQHDARFQSATEISLYDDHSGGSSTQQARGVEYAIDTVAGTATQDFSSGTTPVANATGSFRRYASGADNLVGWGIRAGSGFDEVNGSGSLLMSMRFPNGEWEYRVVKVDPTALDINLLRKTAGLPRPLQPSTSWQSLGGVLTSEPAAASWSPDRLDAFVRGSDQQLWHTFFAGGRWNGWEPLGGSLTSGPAAVSWSSGRLDVFARGTDQQLWHRWFDTNQWSGWEPLGGVLTSSPAVASWSAGRLDVVADGTDNQVWHRWFDANQWNGWEPLGGSTTSDPAAASWAPGRLDIFIRNGDGTMGHRYYQGQWSSSNYEWFAASLAAGPSATSAYSGQLDVVGPGAANVPQRLEYASGWLNWQSLGGMTLQTPSVVRRDASDEDVFVTGTDNFLYVTPLSSATGLGASTRPRPAPRPQDAARL
jgi:hypothetical protein